MEHVIHLNKGRQFLGLLVSVLFIGLGCALIVDPYIFGDLPFSRSKLFAICITLIIIFVAVFIFIGYKLLTKQAGLIINDEGIADHTSALKLGQVKWDEISGFGVKKQIGIPFIVVYLKNPDEFIAKRGKMSKSLIKKNAEEFGTPFAIGTTMLDIKLDELKGLLEAEGARRGVRFE